MGLRNLIKFMKDIIVQQMLTQMTPQALRVLETIATKRDKNVEDVLRDEIENYIARELPLPPVDEIISTMAGRFYELGYFCGTVKNVLKRWQ